MLKLKRLKVLHYRDVAPGSELRFDDGINLILGQNASGKTTLLALISAVCRSAFEGIKDEEFELEYEIGSERFSVEAQVRHRRVPSPEEDALRGAGPTWDDWYTVQVVDREAGESLSYDSAVAAERQEIDLIMEWSFVAALLSSSRQSWRALRTELLESHAFAFRFDESLDCFAAMTGRLSTLRGPATPGLATAGWYRSVDTKGGVSMSRGGYIPGPLARALGRSFQDFPRTTITLGNTTDALARKLAEILGVTTVEISPNIREQRATASESSFLVEGFTFEITRPDGTTIHHDRLSYGQKRLLAFLYYLECNPRVVIADELVNGLHHRWIDACMRELGDRQAFLTSQNPLLFDYATFDSIERVQASFLVCGLEVIDGREQMTWRNMSRDEAQVFFDAYEAGIEHVGDILITRGLW